MTDSADVRVKLVQDMVQRMDSGKSPMMDGVKVGMLKSGNGCGG